jgi:enediyne biosynthesis thioesterase
MRVYEYRHIVSFEETTLVGNVYYVNHIRWQGICREFFIREHAPAVLEELRNGLSLVTVRCSCDYFAEVLPFDEIIVRMRLAAIRQNRITMTFEYVRGGPSGLEVVATGEQQVACMRGQGDKLVAAPIPEVLTAALRAFE